MVGRPDKKIQVLASHPPKLTCWSSRTRSPGDLLFVLRAWGFCQPFICKGQRNNWKGQGVHPPQLVFNICGLSVELSEDVCQFLLGKAYTYLRFATILQRILAECMCALRRSSTCLGDKQIKTKGKERSCRAWGFCQPFICKGQRGFEPGTLLELKIKVTVLDVTFEGEVRFRSNFAWRCPRLTHSGSSKGNDHVGA